MASLSSSYDGVASLYNNYAYSADASLQSYSESINNVLDENLKYNNIASCKINFSNLGKLDFDFLNTSATPLNMKLFNKIAKVDQNMRKINDIFIQLIVNLNCCFLASKYNDVIRTPMQNITQDFCMALLSIAEQAAKSYVVFKTYMCVIKPVSGNPWLKSAGYDWMRSIYSFLYGFEAFFDWIMDGTILNVINDPLETFIKKLQTCAPIMDSDDPEFRVYLLAYQKMLLENQMTTITEYTSTQNITEDGKTVTKKGIENDPLITKIITLKEKYFKNDARLETLNSELKDIYLAGESNIILQAEHNKLLAEQVSILKQLKEASIEFNRKFSDQTTINPREKQFLKDIDSLQNQYYVSQSEYSNVLLLKNKVSCNCLLNILGVTFNTSEDYEIHTSSSFKNIIGRVLYKNKAAWKQALEDIDAHKSVDKSSFLIANLGDIEGLEFDQNEINNLKRLVEYGFSLNDYKFSFVVPDINTSMIQFSGTTESVGQYDISLNEYTVENTTGTHSFSMFTNRILEEKELFKIQVTSSLNSSPTEVIALNKRRQALLKLLSTEKTQYDLNSRNEENKLVNAYNEIYGIYKIVAGNLALYELNNTADSIIKALDAKAKLNDMGSYFDPIKFIEFLMRWGSDVTDDANSYKQRPLKTNTIDVLNEYTTLNTVSDSPWYMHKIKSNIYKGAIKKIDMLMDYDHVVVSLISEKSDIPCGCDVICKIIQWLIDLIISAINGLIKALIARLVSSLMNESVAYIIKFILAKYQCYKDIMSISDKLDRIKRRAALLKEQLQVEYNKAPSPMYCDAVYNNDLATRLETTEIPYKTFVRNPVDEIVYQIPTVTYGTVDEDIILNEVNVSNDVIVRDQIKNAYIPTLYFDCSDGKNPYIELNTPSISDSVVYEMNVIFRIGQFLDAAPVESTIVDAIVASNDITLDDGSTLVLPNTTAISDSVDEALKQVNAKLEDIKNTDIYMTNSCNTTPSYLDFCSLNDLVIQKMEFVNKTSTGVLDSSDHTYGTLSERQYVGVDGLNVYFPEHTYADKDGVYTLADGSEYYDYTIPPFSVYTIDETTTTVTVPKDNILAGTYVEKETVITADPHNSELDTKIKYMIIDEQTITKTYSAIPNDNLHMKQVTKITHSAKKYFTKNFLEILATYSNNVNTAEVRVLLNIVATSSEIKEQYTQVGYNARYPYYIVLDEVASSIKVDNHGSAHYLISKDRLTVLSKNILKDRYLLSQSLAEEIKKSATDEINKDVSNCLLTDEQRQAIAETTFSAEALNVAVTGMVNSINNSAPNITLDSIVQDKNIVTSLDPAATKTTIENSIMFMMLDSSHHIAIQIVNKQLVLHIPSSTVLNSAKIVIDYTLEKNHLYNFTYSVQGRQILLTLMDESKLKYSATVLNIYGYNLVPEYIGGMPVGTLPTGMKTACTLEILNVSYSQVGAADDYYKYTVLNTTPRTSVVTFDYSVVDVTSRIYNVSATTNVTSIDSNLIHLLGVAKEKQKISGYGKVVSNGFFQVYQGILDNFFCSSNLTDFSYTLSVWFYIDKPKSRNSRHVIINDDINNNTIYYNGVTNNLYIDFAGAFQTEIIQNLENKWYCIMIEKYSYEKKYKIILTSKDYNVRIEKIINTPIKFNLMSIGAEYVVGLNYTSLFEGYFGPITVYIGPSTENEKLITCENQYLQVKGIETKLLEE